MDVTPQAIREVQFRERLRGYHPDDVDDYLARVAAAVESLELRLRQAEGLTVRAAGEAGSDVEDSLRRTLVLAQRTADLAIHEAKEEAASLLAEAEARREAMLEEWQQERRRLAEEADQVVRAEIERLSQLRQCLQDDVRALHAYVGAERARLGEVLTEQLDQLNRNAVLRPVPELHEIDVDVVVPPNGIAAEDVSDEPTEAVAAVAGEATGSPDDLGSGAPDPTGVEAAAADPDLIVPDGGGSDEPDDPFMAELRLASTDEEPLGPRDTPPPSEDADIDFFADPDDRSRFGNRLRRRR